MASVTTGVVSAKDRFIAGAGEIPFIQTDVAINPGSSGSPLFNSRGEVVAINSMIYSGSGGYMGLSFAVPINLAMHIAAQLRATGTVRRARLGAEFQEMTPLLAESFGLAQPAGALVVKVEPDSPARRAGLAGRRHRDGHRRRCPSRTFPSCCSGSPGGRPVRAPASRSGAAAGRTRSGSPCPSNQLRKSPSPVRRRPPEWNDGLGLSLGELSPAGAPAASRRQRAAGARIQRGWRAAKASGPAT